MSCELFKERENGKKWMGCAAGRRAGTGSSEENMDDSHVRKGVHLTIEDLIPKVFIVV